MRFWRAPVSSAILAVLVVVGGCALMPVSGPESWDVRAGQKDPLSLPYALVHINPGVTAVLAAARPRLTRFAEQRRPRDITFGIGDIVSVTIFEAAMAPQIGAAIVAIEHKLDPPLVSLMVGIGIPLSFLTLPMWWYVLQGL